jgi:hypothetical protein
MEALSSIITDRGARYRLQIGSTCLIINSLKMSLIQAPLNVLDVIYPSIV